MDEYFSQRSHGSVSAVVGFRICPLGSKLALISPGMPGHDLHKEMLHAGIEYLACLANHIIVWPGNLHLFLHSTQYW